MRHKLIRVTTVPISLKTLLKGQHRFMSENGFEVVGVSSKGNELTDVAKNEGIRVVELEMTRTISPLKDLIALWQFYKLCRAEKPVIVHSHTPKAGIVAMLGAKLAGVPHRLHTVAGMPLMETTGKKRKLLEAVEKLTYWAATGVYPNSTGLYQFICDHNFVAKRKLKVIGNGSSNGIDADYFNPNQITEIQKETLKKELGIEDSDFVFVFVGRLVGDKGINELVSAFIDVNNIGYSNCKLLLVGSFEDELDPLLPETKKSIEKEKNIITVGFQQDVRPFLAVSTCLAFPSYREGFPNVVMQAGAMGLPAIVSDINGCNEIIQEGINGSIIPPKSTIKLKNAMLQMIIQPDTTNRMKLSARKMIVERYSQKVIWNELLENYKSLLANKA